MSLCRLEKPVTRPFDYVGVLKASLMRPRAASPAAIANLSTRGVGRLAKKVAPRQLEWVPRHLADLGRSMGRANRRGAAARRRAGEIGCGRQRPANACSSFDSLRMGGGPMMAPSPEPSLRLCEHFVGPLAAAIAPVTASSR